MSASQASAATAIALQLSGALDSYEREVEALATPRVNPEAYHQLRLRLDEMRRYSVALPGLSVAWIELLIRHFELAHALWKQQQGQADAEAAARLHAKHRHGIEQLRRQCVQILHEQDGAAAP